MNWEEATGRVVVEAAEPHPNDVVLVLGDARVADALAGRVKEVHRGRGPGLEDLAAIPPGLSIVCMQGWLRRRAPAAQRAAIRDLGRILPSRGLVIIGDAMWSFPPDQIDTPEQYGDALDHVQTTATLEGWLRESGFIPDVHRFAPGAGVIVGVRT